MSKKKNKNQHIPAGTGASAPAPAGAASEGNPAEEFTVLTPEGEDRRPQIDRSYAAGRSENVVSLADMAHAEDELQRLKEEAGIVEKGPWWKRLINGYYQYQDNRVRYPVKKWLYLLLNGLLGWCGMHRFYERRWLLGLFYLGLCWSGFPAILCVTDFLIALPKKADENGMITI